MKWKCLLTGRTYTMDGKLRRVSRVFDGAGNVKQKALECLSKRKDNGSPWYGDFVTVVTPLGQIVTVNVDYPVSDRWNELKEN